MKSFTLLLLLSIISIITSAPDNSTTKKPESKPEDTLKSLYDANFDDFKKKTETLVVLFYSPTCPHSAKLLPEFFKASQYFDKNQNIKLVKVDATSQRKLAELYQIQVFPVVIGFKGNEEITYIGKRKAINIVNWVLKKFVSPYQTLKTEKEVNEYLKENDVAIVLFGKAENDIDKPFAEAAKRVEEFPFALISDEKFMEKLNGKPKTITMFKKDNEKRQDLSETDNEQKIFDFVYRFAYPKVMRFCDEVSSLIFERNQSMLILFPDKAKTNDQINLLKNVGDKINYNIKLIYADSGLAYTKKLADFIGIRVKDYPVLRILDNRNGDKVKMYEPLKKEITENNIITFINDWENNKLKQTYKSQEEPKSNKGLIFNLVSKSYKKNVIDNDKDVMVLIYASFCGHCKLFEKAYTELAQKLKGSKNLLLTQIDGTENDIEDFVEYDGFPTILLYPGNKKNEKPIEYEGDRSVNDIIKFLNKYASIPVKGGDSNVNVSVNDDKNKKKKDIKKGKTETKKEKKEEKQPETPKVEDKKSEPKKDDTISDL